MCYPNVTGSYAIVKVGDRYLIGYNDWRKQWEFPAGGIENGETARQAAYRELLEETHQGNLGLASTLALKGDTEEAIELMERGLPISINEKQKSTMRAALCFLYLKAGREDKACSIKS